MTPDGGDSSQTADAQPQTRLSALPMRVVEVFFSPGKLMAALAEHPVWAGALIVGIVLSLAQMLAIPAEVWQAMFREQMLARGQDPNAMQGAASIMRVTALVGGLIGYPLMVLITAGLTTLVFSFILGDEGRFKQYLAVTAHGMLVALVLGLLLVPLKIAQNDMRATLNLGTFLFFLKEGYVYRWAKLFDFSSVWSWLLVAQGAVAIGRRRSFGSAAVVVMVIFMIFISLIALMPSSA
jgi:hypothetical protein